MTDLGRLREADALIQEIVRDLGLDVMQQEFDVVPAQKMLEIMAYRLPVNFSHWSFGRDYEIERTKFEHGSAVPYEVVFNSDPCRAYLMDTNPFAIQVLVMAHVYAHNDFMKNNRHFTNSRRDMISSASEAALRFRSYEEDYGLDAVERVIDAGMSIQWNIDQTSLTKRETEAETRERLYGWRSEPVKSGPYDDLLLESRQLSSGEKRDLRRRTPPEPTENLLGYIVDHSPKPLAEWEKDVLSVIAGQSHYFLPYRSTKIMNEGWATFWHEKIMERLFRDGFLTSEEHGFYNLYNARVKSHNPRGINPYLLGWAIFADIEDRWNKGRFGREYEEIGNAREKREYDTGLMAGREKLFQVRRSYMDWFFVHEFLTERVVDDLDLYVFLEHDRHTHYDVVVEETEFDRVKQYLLRSLMNSGVPRILVVDGNYRSSLQLYLLHAFEGLPLDEEYARRTLSHIHFLWDRPVFLESGEPDGDSIHEKVFMADEHGVSLVEERD